MNEEWLYRDNGFSSFAQMEKEHSNIIQFLSSFLSEEVHRVIDLGCGNGELLRKIVRLRSGVRPFGVDLCPKKIERARKLIPPYKDNFCAEDMFTFAPRLEPRFSLALLMPGRLLEQPKPLAFKHWLLEKCDIILLYAYDDWIMQYGSIDALALECGLPRPSLWAGNVGVVITVIQPGL